MHSNEQSSQQAGMTWTASEGRCAFRITAIVSFLISAGIFYLTCFRTITWWDSAEYTLSAVTLGIPHPPGSLILVLLGWLFSKVPLGFDPAFQLNLFAAGLAALTVALTILAARKTLMQMPIVDSSERTTSTWAVTSLATLCGALLFAFSATFWIYSVKFTPYILSGLFTILILLSALRWWRVSVRSEGLLWLFITMLLFGLDFAVHRTNLLLLPAFAVMVLLRRARLILAWRVWGAALGGLALGLLFHFTTMIIAQSSPWWSAGDPSTFERFWDYISVKQYGGGFLVNFFPRKAPLWDYQIRDYLKLFNRNFLYVGGPFGPAGLIPGIVGTLGLMITVARNARLGISLFLFFLFAGLGAVLYFNIPEAFFRSFDRHYLPSFVVFGLFIVLGAAALIRAAWTAGSATTRYIATIVIFLLIAVGVLNQLWVNYASADGSKDTTAYDIATNYLEPLNTDAILLTSSDINTWSLWYAQVANNIRPDVAVLNLSLINTQWYIRQSARKYPGIGLDYTEDQLNAIRPMKWSDTVITAFTDTDDTLAYHVPPTYGEDVIIPQDLVVIDLLKANAGRRPIYVVNALGNPTYKWLEPYLRHEGLVNRVVTPDSAGLDMELLRTNLLETYTYDGYADSNVIFETPAQWVGQELLHSFALFIEATVATNPEQCRELTDFAVTHINPALVKAPPDLRNFFEQVCQNVTVDTTTGGNEPAETP